MKNAVATGISEDSAMDSDSVNLGSNPSPPATEITDISAVSAPGHDGQASHDEPPGRTEPGTAPHIGSLLDTLEARFPDDRAVTERTRMIRRHLALEAAGKAAPGVKAETTRILCELGDLIAERGGAASTREEA